MITLSPSNMHTYRDCPLRFCGSSVLKDIPWKASKAKSRGSVLHSNIEKCLKLGWQPQITWDSQVDMDFVRRRIDEVHKILPAYDLFIEKELAINKMIQPCGWWDENAFLRAKADAILIPKNLLGGDPIHIVDIKTGKKWDDDDFQLRVEALLAHLIWQKANIYYSYWYVDDGEVCDGYIDFDNGLTPVQDIYDLMREMLLSQKNNYYPAKRNKFCKWCAYFQTEKCTA